ncbi:MAG TPA: hypothetical protein VKB78_09705 [Pirellulales bacterium]|nr:hypothetical protein [Pirellulales bacterium]
MMVFAVVGVLLFVGVLAPFVINRGPTHSPEVRLLTEVAMLDSAFKVYKERHGEYPPSDFDHLDNVNSPQYVALANHLKQAFPDADVKVEIAAIKSLGVRTPAQAVCFWLSGFAVERTRPVSSMHTGLSASREAPIYDFEKTRLRFFKPGDQVPVYVPNGGEGAPYLYFAAVSYATQAPFCAVDWKGAGNGTARPYLSDKAPGQFVNPNSFQIISAGLDGDYGGGVGSFPSSKGYERGDYDNIVNFSDRNLGDAVPH